LNVGETYSRVSTSATEHEVITVARKDSVKSCSTVDCFVAGAAEGFAVALSSGGRVASEG
jgi:hypothetical protein